MDTTLDINVAGFLNDILTNRNASIKNFEEKVPSLKFDEINSTVWQFIVLKSLDSEYSYLMPLAHHLLDHNYVVVDNSMVKYAALNGYKLESGLNRMQQPLDEVNKMTQECGFTEKLVIKNEPAEAFLALAKKIVNHSTEQDFQSVKDIFVSAGLDITNIKLLQKPQTQKKLSV